MTIQFARLEKAGPDEDDDHLTFGLERDWAALPLQKPETKE